MECSAESTAPEIGKEQKTATSEGDEEERFMESLNASLLIQTPLQVSLEMIRKRLRKQSKTIEALSQQATSNDESHRTRELVLFLARLQTAERGLLELRSSKLSPFVQSEVLTRLDVLETRLQHTSEEYNTQLEDIRLQHKLYILQLKHLAHGGDTDQLKDDREDAPHSETQDANTAADESDCSTCVKLAEIQERVSSLEVLLREGRDRLEAQQLALDKRHTDDIAALKRLLKTKIEVPYSYIDRIESRLDAIEQHFSDVGASYEAWKGKIEERLDTIHSRLQSVETHQHISEQRVETLMSTALSKLTTNIDVVSRTEFKQLKQQLKETLSRDDIRELVQEEISQWRDKEAQQTPKGKEVLSPRKEQFGSVTRFGYSCLSCGRDVSPVRPQAVDDLTEEYSQLPLSEGSKKKAISHSMPLGPGLNAAELRKLHFVSDNRESMPVSKSELSKKKTVERQLTESARKETTEAHQLLFDNNQSHSKPTRYIRRSKTPIFL